MTVFDVYLNGRKICRAGVGNDGVLTTLVTWAHVRPAPATGKRGRARNETRLHVGGLAHDTHRTWAGRLLKAGDRVIVSVLKAETFDPPARVKSSDPAGRQEQERRYYERLKQKYEPAGADRVEPASRERAERVESEAIRTQFLNVDLDIWSRRPLQRLVDAFGRQVVVLNVGEENGRWGAHLEHAMDASRSDVDTAIQRLVRIVQRLPSDARRIWDGAERREFNVGIQSGVTPYASEFRVEPATLEAIARVNARLALTVYGAATARIPKPRR
jgi:hypothetical protein